VLLFASVSWSLDFLKTLRMESFGIVVFGEW